VVDGPEIDLGFQEYFVGHHHDLEVRGIVLRGIEAATPAPGVIQAIEEAERIVICPSNPLVSIGPVLAVPGVGTAVAARRDDVVAVSPIVGGRALKGPADRMLSDLGYTSSVAGVARLWAPYAAALIIDPADADQAAEVEAAGMRAVVTPSVMSNPEVARALALAAVAPHSTTAS
jgi:LPPG:FO 2-phospho-L-lactate transferase